MRLAAVTIRDSLLVSASIRYVTATGDDDASGATWTTAKRTVAAAVAALPRAGSGGTAHHAGIVHVGPGTFTESVAPIPLNANIRIVGMGEALTTIKLGNGLDTDLFAPEEGFTGWSHYARLENLTLDGNKANNAAGSLISLRNGGFGASLHNVSLNNAAERGLRVINNAVNVYLYNVTGSGCAAGFMHVSLAENANNANVGVYGAQVDDCGAAPFVIDSAADGDANTFLFSGVKTEASSSDYHENVIAVTSTGDNAPLVVVDALTAWRHGSATDGAVIYEAGTSKPKWALRAVTRSGYAAAFLSGITEQEIAGPIASGVVNSAVQNIQ